MFKSARWRSEKNKFKVEFRLQFRATKVLHIGEDALVISVVPADYGKPTVKSDRATVRDGNCFWENPVYETVKFNRDSKSGKIHERMYHFVVGTGLSKAGIIGEASIDFSNYAEATKVSLVSLPLKNSKTEAVLHVSIQRIQEPSELRVAEETIDTKLDYKGHSLKAHLDNRERDGIMRSDYEDMTPKNEVAQIAEVIRNRRASIGSDDTMSSSDSISGVEIPWQPQIENGGVHPQPAEMLSSQGLLELKTNVQMPVYKEHQRSHWVWLGSSANEASTDDSSSTPSETSPRQHLEEASDIVMEKLKSDVAVLSRQVEMAEVELQTLRKQIVKENKKGQDLFRELASLKEERDALKGECERLRGFQRRADDTKSRANSQFEEGDSKAIIQELRQELYYAKELNSNLRLQLQKTQESNSELLLAVQDLEEMLEQKNKETLNISNEAPEKCTLEKLQENDSSHHLDDDEEQKALDELVKEHGEPKEAHLLEQQIMDMHSEIEIYQRDKDELELQIEQLALDYEILKQENHEMANKIEQSVMQEQLKLQYESSTSYATTRELESQMEKLENELKARSKESEEALVKVAELEAHVSSLEEELERKSKRFEADLDAMMFAKVEQEQRAIRAEETLESELKVRSKESAEALVKIGELEAHSCSLEGELERQSKRFEGDLDALMCSKIEQEQRAIRAEETLQKTRWQNANTAERIQEEFKRLSVQMTSTFAANEKLAHKAIAEANELRLHKRHLEEMIQNNSEEQQSVKDSYEARLHQLTSKVLLLTNQIESMQSEIEDRVLKMEHQKKQAEATQKLLSDEISKLRAEIVAKNKILSEEIKGKDSLMHQLEEMRASFKEMELLLDQGDNEKAELEIWIRMANNEAEDFQNELNKMRCLLEEKELLTHNLKTELDSTQTQLTELKSSKAQIVVQRDELRRQVVSLTEDLKKKEDAINHMEKMRMKDDNGQGPTHDSDEVAVLKETIKLLEDQIKFKETSSATFLNHDGENGDDKVMVQQVTIEDELKREMALLKERNELMETELKELQGRYSEISLKFAEVEGERQQLVMKVRKLKKHKEETEPPSSP